MKAIFEFDVSNSCAKCALCYRYKLSFSPIEGYERSCGSHICVVTREFLDNADAPPPSSCPLKIVPDYAGSDQDAVSLGKDQEWAKAVNEELLPCKLGDTVYWISPFNTCIYQGIIFAIKTSKFGIGLEISQSEKNHLTVKRELEKCFFTREEAEAALKEREV